MDKVEALCYQEIVGGLEYCNMGKEEWVAWDTQNQKPLLDYIPTLSRLENKWFVFIFLEGKHASQIIDLL